MPRRRLPSPGQGSAPEVVALMSIRRRSVRVVLAVLVVLAGGLPEAPARAAPAEPVTFQGVLRYSESGPGASAEGLVNAFFVGAAAAPVVVARLQTGVQRLLATMPQLAGSGDLQRFLRGSDNFDLSGLPLRTSYSALVDFTLEQGADGAFHLKSGKVAWTSDNTSRFSYDSGNLMDNFHGSGTHTLDPSEAVIDLSFDFAADPPTFELKVDLTHPTPVNGRTEWVFWDGAGSMWYEATGGRRVWGGHCCGEQFPEEPSDGEPSDHGVHYIRKAPLSELGGGMETFRNLLDAQVVARWQITDECRASIEQPAADAELVFRGGPPGEARDAAAATVSPREWAEDLVWTFPDLTGSSLETEPDDRRGGQVRFVYEGLPGGNDGFGERRVEASFRTLGDRCRDPEPREVRFYFAREEQTNPDGDVPNWFYYWKQTSAAQGHAANMVFGGSGCTSPVAGLRVAGYYDRAGDPANIHICESAHLRFANPINGRVNEGIDSFAVTVVHEWTHLVNETAWWPIAYFRSQDRDEDGVPDDLEAGLGFIAGVADSKYPGIIDAEVPSYLAEASWVLGSADTEDWASPGKQSEASQ